VRILHIANVENQPESGVANVIPQILVSQSKIADIALLNLNNYEIPGATFSSFSSSKYKTIKSIFPHFDRPDLVIFHEIYKPQFINYYRELLKEDIPYIIIPHGSLTVQSQSIKRLKKILGNIIAFNAFIKKAHAIQYLSRSEQSRTFIQADHRYVILGNGIRVGKKHKKDFSAMALQFLYIGRLDVETKGLDILLEAVAQNAQTFRQNTSQLVIAGPDCNGGREHLQLLTNRHEIGDIVRIEEAVYGKEKLSRILGADVFVQVSRTEAQSLALMEAMGLGMPCITSPASAFYEPTNINIAIDTDGSVDSISTVLGKILNNEFKLDVISKKARQYILDNASWDAVTAETLQRYREILVEKLSNQNPSVDNVPS